MAFSTRQTLEALALKRLRALAENVSLLLQGKVHPDSQSSHIFLARRAIFESNSTRTSESRFSIRSLGMTSVTASRPMANVGFCIWRPPVRCGPTFLAIGTSPL